jgi:hypothetical protein
MLLPTPPTVTSKIFRLLHAQKQSYSLLLFLSLSLRAVIAQSVQRWATGWIIGILGFDSRRGLGIFLFTTAMSRTAQGPTQPPIQWVPGALTPGLKWPGREANHSPASSAEVNESVELYFHSPNTPSWRGAELTKKYRDNFTCTFTFVAAVVIVVVVVVVVVIIMV